MTCWSVCDSESCQRLREDVRRGEGGEGSESLTLRLASAVCPVPTTARFDRVQTELIKNEY